MNERPIIFSGPMVQAILDGRKTQTRRPIKHRAAFRIEHEKCSNEDARERDNAPLRLRPEDESAARAYLIDNCPYGQPGDRLWVGETWQSEYVRGWEQFGPVRYRATGAERCMGVRTRCPA